MVLAKTYLQEHEKNRLIKLQILLSILDDLANISNIGRKLQLNLTLDCEGKL